MKTDIHRFFLKFILSFGGSILVGILFFGSSVFLFAHSAFQFVGFGIFGAVILTSAHLTSPSRSFAVVILATVLYECALTSFGTRMIFRDVFFLLGIGAMIVFYCLYFYKNLEAIPVARPLVLAAMLALNGIIITAVLSVVIQFALEGTPVPFAAIGQNLSLEFLIGIGLGVGDECSELKLLKPKMLPS